MLVAQGTLDINEAALIEFGKYFAHTITDYYNEKRIEEMSQLYEEDLNTNLEPNHMSKTNDPNSGKPKVMETVKRNDISGTSFHKNKIDKSFTQNKMFEEFSCNLRKTANRKPNKSRDKSALIKKIRKRHPNSRLFKAEGVLKPMHDYKNGSFPKIF